MNLLRRFRPIFHICGKIERDFSEMSRSSVGDFCGPLLRRQKVSPAAERHPGQRQLNPSLTPFERVLAVPRGCSYPLP